MRIGFATTLRFTGVRIAVKTLQNVMYTKKDYPPAIWYVYVANATIMFFARSPERKKMAKLDNVRHIVNNRLSYLEERIDGELLLSNLCKANTLFNAEHRKHLDKAYRHFDEKIVLKEILFVMEEE